MYDNIICYIRLCSIYINTLLRNVIICIALVSVILFLICNVMHSRNIVNYAYIWCMLTSKFSTTKVMLKSNCVLCAKLLSEYLDFKLL